jgi:hypothetical protein
MAFPRNIESYCIVYVVSRTFGAVICYLHYPYIDSSRYKVNSMFLEPGSC